MTSRDSSSLVDVLQAAKRIAEFIEGLDEPAFERDVKTQSAVLHQIMVMGEAVTRLSESFRETNDDVPWRLIVGMRNQLIHGYYEVDLHEVWHTASIDVPKLLDKLAPLAPEE